MTKKLLLFCCAVTIFTMPAAALDLGLRLTDAIPAVMVMGAALLTAYITRKVREKHNAKKREERRLERIARTHGSQNKKRKKHASR